MIREDEREPGGHDAGRQGVDTPTRLYRTDRITVEWYAGRCMHSGRCVRALPRVFDPRRRPWVDVEAADADAVSRAVLGCPSGALQLGLPRDASPARQSPTPPPRMTDRAERHDVDS